MKSNNRLHIKNILSSGIKLYGTFEYSNLNSGKGVFSLRYGDIEFSENHDKFYYDKIVYMLYG